MDFLRDACLGWQNYKDHGKLAALFLLVLLYLVFARKRRTGDELWTRNYGIAAAALCVFPPTAALLLCYQTRFYSYEWIWSIVPVTAVIALGGTLFLTEALRPVTGIKNTCYNIILVCMTIGILLLCGRLGEDSWGWRTEARSRLHAESVLDAALDETGAEEICLWAPREILEYARARDGRVRLLYGRDMWEPALNAYSYDKYGEDPERLYLWMERVSETGCWSCEIERIADSKHVRETVTGEEQIGYALQKGVTAVLLKDNLTEESLEEMNAFVLEQDLEALHVQGYYLLKAR